MKFQFQLIYCSRSWIQLLDQLTKIEVIKKIECPDRFAQFLAGSKRLAILRLKNSQLGQDFYDLLPSITSAVCELEFDDGRNQELNLRFVSRMFRLRRICSGRCLLTAIQQGDFELNKFAEIEFAIDEREDFFGYLYRYETIPRNSEVRAYKYRHDKNCNDKNPHLCCFGSVAKSPELSKKRVFENIDNQAFMKFYFSFKKPSLLVKIAQSFSSISRHLNLNFVD